MGIIAIVIIFISTPRKEAIFASFDSRVPIH